MEDGLPRKLTAILYADVAGYSRLTEDDEDATHRTLREYLDLISGVIESHGGTVMHYAGDAVLAQFPAVVDAMAAAVEGQGKLKGKNADLPDDRKVEFRVGLNLGDVIEDRGDIYGDGVNVAARLESLADPGGTCISESVRTALGNKLSLDFEDIGKQEVKNITEPVRAYKVMMQEKEELVTPSSRAAALEHADKPSIAVLPFTNMSGDSEQEYFSDGISEDLITALSRFKNLLVTSRNSSFAYKGAPVDVREVGTRLRVRYVVEGSVRRAGNRVRVTGQLIDAVTDNHLWAERYDRDLDDIFSVQDEIVRGIASAIPGHINRAAIEQIRHKAPSNLTAYDCELRGRWALTHWGDGLEAALEWFERAVQADPDYALAHAALAMAYLYGQVVLGLPRETVLARGNEHARRAIALDDRDPTVNAYAAFAYHMGGVHALARKHAARAVELNPNDPFVLYVQACALSYTGDPKEALEWFAKSEELEPYAPDDQRLDTLCDCHYMLGDYHKVEEIHKVYREKPAFLYVIAAIAFAQAGEMEKSKLAREHYERLRPAEHDVKAMCNVQVQMCSRREDREHWLEGYRKAGFEV